MTDSETVIVVRLDSARAEALRRWADIGQRSLEATVLVAIDEYLWIPDNEYSR
ncbi:hypothetical protein [Cryptosporangium aurantiacum]|uniref:CopG family transcriptional regulator n=1 Tax=Cryptosporangium aurantiacum TaxID=134849 RepID=A0A1M7QTG8_9ACTN|nr:hypothetical protein [Cryptosporangium aurantiacum]SHN35025.1 hypothetical protein SAMN05443668_105338 [Cryptosporangium aurantiacum]